VIFFSLSIDKSFQLRRTPMSHVLYVYYLYGVHSAANAGNQFWNTFLKA